MSTYLLLYDHYDGDEIEVEEAETAENGQSSGSAVNDSAPDVKG